MAKMMTIGEAAADLGMSTATLRIWERKGYLAALRLPSGQRRYTPEEIARVKARMFSAATPAATPAEKVIAEAKGVAVS